MIITSPDLMERARRGSLTERDIARLYAEVEDIHALNMAARAAAEKKKRREAAYAAAVSGYARSMAPLFGVDVPTDFRLYGIENGIPNGDRA